MFYPYLSFLAQVETWQCWGNHCRAFRESSIKTDEATLCKEDYIRKILCFLRYTLYVVTYVFKFGAGLDVSSLIFNINLFKALYSVKKKFQLGDNFEKAR